MTNGLEGALKVCYTFFSIAKKEQKKQYDFNPIVTTAKMLDDCY